MRNTQDASIVFERYHFYPGDTISCKVFIPQKKTRLCANLTLSLYVLEKVSYNSKEGKMNHVRTVYENSKILFKRNILMRLAHFGRSFNNDADSIYDASFTLPLDVPPSVGTYIRYLVRLETGSSRSLVCPIEEIYVHPKLNFTSYFTPAAGNGITKVSKTDGETSIAAKLNEYVFKRNDMVKIEMKLFSQSQSVKAVEISLLEIVELAADSRGELSPEKFGFIKDRIIFDDKIRSIVPLVNNKVVPCQFGVQIPSDIHISVPHKRYHAQPGTRLVPNTQGANIGVFTGPVAISHVIRISLHKQRSRNSSLVLHLDLPILITSGTSSHMSPSAPNSSETNELTLSPTAPIAIEFPQ